MILKEKANPVQLIRHLRAKKNKSLSAHASVVNYNFKK